MNTKSNSMPKSIANLTLITFGAVAITLGLTPWVNSDSLIIPKGIILVCMAAYFSPKLLRLLVKSKKSKGLKFLNAVALLFLFQMILVMIFTSAPFEQQFFGRTGRGLGFATYASLIVLLLIVAYSAMENNAAQKIIIGIVVACVISSLYSVLQRFGYDIFDWVTYTNGIIGTLGNPNFQSSFVAMAIMPSFVIFLGHKNYLIPSSILILFLIFTLFLCESTQGYIASAIAFSSFLLVYFWYKRKLYFLMLLFVTIILGLVSVLGMLNMGPLSTYLYKVSVQSRGEMWRTGIQTIRDNPLFGIGLDSFGDFSLKYRDFSTANGINEYTDNAHNFFLQFAITGGVLMSLIYTSIILIGLYSFYASQKKIGRFDAKLSAIFASWISFQAQSFISPANIAMLVWNFIITGFIIGYANLVLVNIDQTQKKLIANFDISRPLGFLLLIVSFVIMYPWYNVDKITWAANQAKNGTALVQAAQLYPESSVRYTRVGIALYSSNLLNESLVVAKSAVKFNPNSVQGWILILINQSASIEDRRLAREKVLKLDPYNKEAASIKL